uniref:Uncharacterized protein n=1 Tax=Anguilla anguilla TaxID=7936 RepID=A0A0E9PUX7_ANGAN
MYKLRDTCIQLSLNRCLCSTSITHLYILTTPKF